MPKNYDNDDNGDDDDENYSDHDFDNGNPLGLWLGGPGGVARERALVGGELLWHLNIVMVMVMDIVININIFKSSSVWWKLVLC